MSFISRLALFGLAAALLHPGPARGQGRATSSYGEREQKKHPPISTKRVAGDPNLCRPESGPLQLPDIPEASGIALSARTPGIVWINSDAHDPVITAADLNGATKGHVRITGAKARNWEAIAVAPCSRGSCLFIGDLG